MSGGDISSNKVNVANSFSNGDLVTYHAPNVQAEFSSGQVNVQLTYSGSDVNGHTGAAHVIYFALDTNGNGKLDNGDDVGLNTGDRIYYSASNPGDAIGGLVERQLLLGDPDRRSRLRARRQQVPRDGQRRRLRLGSVAGRR